MTALRAFSTDFTPEFAKRGKTVNVPVIGAANASYDFAGSYSANADSDVQGIPVVLDRHKVQSLHLTDKEVSESSWVYPSLLRPVLIDNACGGLDTRSDGGGDGSLIEGEV